MTKLTRHLIELLSQTLRDISIDHLILEFEKTDFHLAALLLREIKRSGLGVWETSVINRRYLSLDREITARLINEISIRYFIASEKIEETISQVRIGFIYYGFSASLDLDRDMDLEFEALALSLLIGGDKSGGLRDDDLAKFLIHTGELRGEFLELLPLVDGKSEATNAFLDSVNNLSDPFPGLCRSNVGYGTLGVDAWEGQQWELNLLLESLPDGHSNPVQRQRNRLSTLAVVSTEPYRRGSLTAELSAEYPQLVPRLWDKAEDFIQEEFAYLGLKNKKDLLGLWDTVFGDGLYYILNRLDALGIITLKELPYTTELNQANLLRQLEQSEVDFSVPVDEPKEHIKKVTRLSSTLLSFAYIKHLLGRPFESYSYLAMSASLGSIAAHVLLMQNSPSIPMELKRNKYLIFTCDILARDSEFNMGLLGFMTALRRSDLFRHKIGEDIKKMMLHLHSDQSPPLSDGESDQILDGLQSRVAS